MKYFSLALTVLLVTKVNAGVRDLNPQEEQDALQLYLRVCGQGQGATGSRSVDGVNIHCKTSTQQSVQEVLSHQVSVPTGPNQQQDIVFVQPPPVSYQHSIQLNGQSGQAGQTKIFVLPQRANHQISTNFNIGQINRSKPVVHFLNRNGQNLNSIQTGNPLQNLNPIQNLNTLQNSNNLQNFNPNQNLQTLNPLQNLNNLQNVNPINTNSNFRPNSLQNSLQVGSQGQTVSNLLNNVRATQGNFPRTQQTSATTQFGPQNQSPRNLLQSLNSQTQQFPNNLQATPTPFLNNQQRNSFPIQNPAGSFLQGNNQFPIRNDGVFVNPPVAPIPAPIRVEHGHQGLHTVPVPQVLPKQHVQFHGPPQAVKNPPLHGEPGLAKHLEPLIPQGAVLEKQQVHVQEISAQTGQFVHKQLPIQAVEKHQPVQLQELPVQVIHKHTYQQPPHPHQVQLAEKHPGQIQQVPVQFVHKQHHHLPVQFQEIHPTGQVGFHHGHGQPIHFQHQSYGHGLNPFDLGDPQGFPLGEDLPIFGPGHPPGFAKA